MKHDYQTSGKIGIGAAAFILAALVLSAIYASYNLFPFGNNTLSWGDMNQQVIPLMLEFKDILQGKSGMLLNLQNAGGMSFWGVFFFFLSSPFTFLVLIIDKCDIYFLVNILVLLKLSLAAFSASLFFKEEAPRLENTLNLFLAVSYALCGYGMLYYQNLVWLDILYLFPLLMLGLVRLLYSGKGLLFTVVLCIVIIVNYYLSYMVFISLIIISTLMIKYCVTKENRGEIAGKLGAGAILSLLITAVVWLPSLLQCLSSARTDTDIVSLIKSHGLFSEITTTLPILLCSAGAICVPFLIGLSKPPKKDTAILLSVVLTTVPLIIEPINMMWHTGSYQAFPARYGYIPLFLCLWYLSQRLTDDEFEEYHHRLRRKRYGLFQLVAAFHLILMGIFLLNYRMGEMSSYNFTLWLTYESFIYLLTFSICAAVIIFMSCILLRKGKIGRAQFSCALLAVCLIQGGFHASVFMGPTAHCPNKERQILQVENTLDDNGLYRVKLDNKFCDVNLLGATGYPTLNHYTSLTDGNFLFSIKKLGYSSYWMETSACCGTKLTDILLSNKYSLDQSLKWTYTGSGNIGYIVPTGVIPKYQNEKNDRLLLQNRLYTSVTKSSEMAFEKYNPNLYKGVSANYSENKTFLSVEDFNGSICYSISVGDVETLYFDAFCKNTTALREDIYSGFDIYVNGKMVMEKYPNQKCNGIISLGTFSHTNVDIELKVNKNIEASSFGVYGIKESKVEAFAKSLGKTKLQYKNNSIYGTLEAPGKGRSLFLSLPRYKGMRVYINDKPAVISTVLDCFMEIPLIEGRQTIRLTYVPDGLYAGIGISISALLLSTAYFITVRKRKPSYFRYIWYAISLPLLYISFFVVIAVIYVIPMLLVFI